MHGPLQMTSNLSTRIIRLHVYSRKYLLSWHDKHVFRFSDSPVRHEGCMDYWNYRVQRRELGLLLPKSVLFPPKFPESPVFFPKGGNRSVSVFWPSAKFPHSRFVPRPSLSPIFLPFSPTKKRNQEHFFSMIMAINA